MNKNERMNIVRQQLAAAAGGRARRDTTAEPLPVSVERSRITLAGLRFMGEEPHPLQSFPREETDMTQTNFVKLDMPMDDDTWWKEARRAARWWWSYEELVDDAKGDLDHLRAQGSDPYDAVKGVGQELDLHEFGPAWGGW